MSLCPHCNKQNFDTAKFCTGCGAKFTEQVVVPVQQTGDSVDAGKEQIKNQCTYCGSIYPAGAKFCTSCGKSTFVQSTDEGLLDGVETITQPKTEQITCKICGAHCTDKVKFCTSCGCSIQSQIDTANQKEEILTTVPEISGNLQDSAVEVNDADTILTVETSVEENSQSVAGPENKPEDEESTPSEIIVSDVTETAINPDEASANVSTAIEPEEPFALPAASQTDGNAAEPDLAGTETESHTEQKPDDGQINDNTQSVSETVTSATEKQDITIAEMVQKDVEGTDLSAGAVLSSEELDKLFAGERKKVFRKRIWVSLGLLLLAGMFVAAYMLFLKPDTRTNKKTEINKSTQDIPPQGKGSNFVEDTSSTLAAAKADSISGIKPVTAPAAPLQKETSGKVIESADATGKETLIPATPSKAKAIKDLAGITICNNVTLAENTPAISYTIAKKNSRQCFVVLTLQPQDTKTKYVVTSVYENINNSFVFKSHSCNVVQEAVPKKEIQPSPLQNHDVTGTLMKYLAGKKTFCGVEYNNTASISIIKIGSPQIYGDTGNTSYSVALMINGQERKCQVIFTANGKYFINQLK